MPHLQQIIQWLTSLPGSRQLRSQGRIRFDHSFSPPPGSPLTRLLALPATCGRWGIALAPLVDLHPEKSTQCGGSPGSFEAASSIGASLDLGGGKLRNAKGPSAWLSRGD